MPNQYDVSYFAQNAQPNLSLYKTVRRRLLFDSSIRAIAVIFTLFFICVGVTSTYKKNGITEAIISLIIVGGIVLAILWCVLRLYDFFINKPLSLGIKKYAENQFKKKIPPEFNAGTFITSGFPPYLLAIDYQNCMIMISEYENKYMPNYIASQEINAVNVMNNKKIETKTSISVSSLGCKGKTTSKITDNVFLEIHYQKIGEAPSWYSLPFGENRQKAESIAAAILKM